MEKLETQLAALRSRAETLRTRHAAAEAAFVDADAKLQQHLLEADLDADEKVRVKLEAAVAAAALTRDSLAKAMAAQHVKVAEVEAKIAAERTAIERNEAADRLSCDLDKFEAALPAYLTAARQLADAAEAFGHFHFESGSLAAFTRNGAGQIDVAGAFAVTELRGIVSGIRNGSRPIPKKPNPPPVVAPSPAPPTVTVFMIHSARYRDHDGKKRFAGQFEDVIMPVATAQKAMRLNLAVPVTDPRRATLRGARNGDYRPDAPDVIDIDAVAEHTGPEKNDVIAQARITVIDRGVPERKLLIAAPRL